MLEIPKIGRDPNGVPRIEADSEEGLYWGQGYVHARDRGLQMLLMRVLGQGRLSETLDSSDASLSTDLFFRRMNWAGKTADQVALISQPYRNLCEAYCAGANAAFENKLP